MLDNSSLESTMMRLQEDLLFDINHARHLYHALINMIMSFSYVRCNVQWILYIKRFLIELYLPTRYSDTQITDWSWQKMIDWNPKDSFMQTLQIQRIIINIRKLFEEDCAIDLVFSCVCVFFLVKTCFLVFISNFLELRFYTLINHASVIFSLIFHYMFVCCSLSSKKCYSINVALLLCETSLFFLVECETHCFLK